MSKRVANELRMLAALCAGAKRRWNKVGILRLYWEEHRENPDSEPGGGKVVGKWIDPITYVVRKSSASRIPPEFNKAVDPGRTSVGPGLRVRWICHETEESARRSTGNDSLSRLSHEAARLRLRLRRETRGKVELPERYRVLRRAYLLRKLLLAGDPDRGRPPPNAFDTPGTWQRRVMVVVFVAIFVVAWVYIFTGPW